MGDVGLLAFDLKAIWYPGDTKIVLSGSYVSNFIVKNARFDGITNQTAKGFQISALGTVTAASISQPTIFPIPDKTINGIKTKPESILINVENSNSVNVNVLSQKVDEDGGKSANLGRPSPVEQNFTPWVNSAMAFVQSRYTNFTPALISVTGFRKQTQGSFYRVDYVASFSLKAKDPSKSDDSVTVAGGAKDTNGTMVPFEVGLGMGSIEDSQPIKDISSLKIDLLSIVRDFEKSNGRYTIFNLKQVSKTSPPILEFFCDEFGITKVATVGIDGKKVVP